MKKAHIFNIGETINGLIIVDKARDEKYNYKTYEVQSITYPDAPTYFMFETSLTKGRGDGYLPGGGRVYEGNSLYSKKEYRKYIVDIEQSKTISPSHSKKITMKCPECNNIKRIAPHILLKQGLSCSLCSKNISYPELVVLSYGEVKNLNLQHQVVFNDLPNRRIDFYSEKIGVIETHGRAHYEENKMMNHKNTIESDIEKRKYCKEKGLRLIELDCRYSDFDFIIDNINKCKHLPNITKKDEVEILKVMEQNKRYPVKEMIELYNEGNTTYQIAKKYNISHATAGNILKRNGVELKNASIKRRKQVKCINTKETFNSLTEASEYYKVERSGIRNACNGKAKSAGKHPITEEKLTWEFIN